MKPERTARSDRSMTTREAILTAAEWLFAERGMYAVSNRQISEAAGQGNNAAACYHFGSRTDLLRAIESKHREPIEELRGRMLADVGDSTELRDWVGTLVRPLTDHLAALGTPSWYARFAAQAMADPTYRQVVTKDALTSPMLVQTIDGINRCLPNLPKRVRSERGRDGPQSADAHLRRTRGRAGRARIAALAMAGRRRGTDRRDRRAVARAGPCGLSEPRRRLDKNQGAR